MHAVILNGAREGDDACEGANETLVRELEALGWTVESIALREKSVRPCRGCFGCWLKTPGECVQDDDGRLVARALAGADLQILLTRLSFGGYGGLLKTALDRIIPNILPFFTTRRGEMRHVLRYPDPACFLGVGVQAATDAESAAVFAELVERNALNMDSPVFGALVVAEDEPETARAERLRAFVARVGSGSAARRAAG